MREYVCIWPISFGLPFYLVCASQKCVLKFVPPLMGIIYLVTCCLIMSVLGSIGFHQNNNDSATKLPCSLSTLSISGWWVRWFDAHPILSSSWDDASTTDQKD